MLIKIMELPTLTIIQKKKTRCIWFGIIAKFICYSSLESDIKLFRRSGLFIQSSN